MEPLYNTDLLSHMLPQDRLHVFITEQCLPALSKHLKTFQFYISCTDYEALINEIESLYLITTALHATSINALIESFLRKMNMNGHFVDDGNDELGMISLLVSELLEQLRNDFISMN